MSRDKKIMQYDVLRVIATLLVVISHARYYMMDTSYGGCDYSALVNADLLSWRVAGLITEFLNTFQMPLFMALGGALFYGSMQRGKFPTLGTLAADKAKRLLIPFLVVSMVYAFPVKLLTGYYNGSANVLWDFVVGQLLVQGNTYLWFLPTMFLDFLICYLLERYIKIPKVLKLLVLAVLSEVFYKFEIQLISYAMQYAVWFYAGYCFEDVRHKIDGKGKALYGIIGCFLAVLIYLGSRLLPGGLATGLCAYFGIRWLVPVMMGLSLYLISCKLAQTPLVSSRFYGALSRNSFGIYLYSDPMNYVVLFAASRWCGGFLFGNVFGAGILYLLRIVLSATTGLTISAILHRCRLKYLV